jgi:hypothetical protein
MVVREIIAWQRVKKLSREGGFICSHLKSMCLKAEISETVYHRMLRRVIALQRKRRISTAFFKDGYVYGNGGAVWDQHSPGRIRWINEQIAALGNK